MEFSPIPPRLEFAENLSPAQLSGNPRGFFDRHWRSEDVLFREGNPRAEQWSGDLRVVVPPGPIPNPEVKRDIADGSVSKGRARVGRCQSLTAPWLFQSRGGFLLSVAKLESGIGKCSFTFGPRRPTPRPSLLPPPAIMDDRYRGGIHVNVYENSCLVGTARRAVRSVLN